MQMVKFPSIDQFRNVIKQVRDRAKYRGQPLPVLQFNGSVKLHGTNAGVIKDPRTNEIWCQSREQIITPEKDNMGFARFISELPCRGIDTYFNIAATVYGHNNVKQGDLIGIYGEWCGQGIMKGVAISQVPKRFVVFGIKVYTPGEVTEDGQDCGESHWFSPKQLALVQELYDVEMYRIEPDYKGRIFCIQDFQTWTVEIDFSQPELIQNYLVELTDGVEKLCPVGKSFGVDGIGEGIVWRCISSWSYPFDSGIDVSMVQIKTNDLIFKVKGEKHSDTKVTTTASVDVEKVATIKEFATNVCTDHRLEKMIEKMKETNIEVNIQNTGQFLKLVGSDVIKEESDTIDTSGLDRKDVMPAVNATARQWYMKLVNKIFFD